jgi:hypothetical protein
MANDLFLNVGHLFPIGSSALNESVTTPRYPTGGIGFFQDDFGLRVARYLKNVSGSAQGRGELASRPANVTVTNISSGSTTHIITSGLTANIHVGKILLCTDDAGAAGASPEGEVGIIVANSTTRVDIDSRRPFLTACAVNDDFSIVATYQAVDAADNDLSINVRGVALCDVTDGDFAFYQINGLCPDVKHTAVAVTAGDALVAAAAAVTTYAAGSDGQELVVGYSPNGMSVDNATLAAMAFVSLFPPTPTLTAP